MRSDAARWQAWALELASSVVGRTSPNPAVGAVLVKDDVIVGEGASQSAGGAHAEVMALQAAGTQARGATLYVTLEPCNHYGRTPPCCAALIAAGIAEVHYAVVDPNPHVVGGGHRALVEAGVRVIQGTGSWAAKAQRLNEAFLHWIVTGRPFVTAKWAMSLDGRIATRTGDSRWITGELARQRVHQLRNQIDGILVGSGTVLKDNPALTTRLDKPEQAELRHPLRVVLDARGRTPLNARLVTGELPGQTLIATTHASSESWRKALMLAGNEVLVLPAAREEGVDLGALLELLGQRQLLSLLIEGGPTVLGAFAQSSLINKYSVFVAPVILGGTQAPGPLGGEGVSLLAEANRLNLDAVERFDQDVLLTCYPLP